MEISCKIMNCYLVLKSGPPTITSWFPQNFIRVPKQWAEEEGDGAAGARLTSAPSEETCSWWTIPSPSALSNNFGAGLSKGFGSEVCPLA